MTAKTLTERQKLAMPLNIGKCNRRKGKPPPVFSCRRVKQPTQRKFSEKINGKVNDGGPTPEWLAKRAAILGSIDAVGELDDPLSALLARGLISENDLATADGWRRLYQQHFGAPHARARQMTITSRGRHDSPAPSRRQQSAYGTLNTAMVKAVGRKAFNETVHPLLLDRTWPAWLAAAIKGDNPKELQIVRAALSGIPLPRTKQQLYEERQRQGLRMYKAYMPADRVEDLLINGGFLDRQYADDKKRVEAAFQRMIESLTLADMRAPYR